MRDAGGGGTESAVLAVPEGRLAFCWRNCISPKEAGEE